MQLVEHIVSFMDFIDRQRQEASSSQSELEKVTLKLCGLWCRNTETSTNFMFQGLQEAKGWAKESEKQTT